jgi:hypothetical protein
MVDLGTVDPLHDHKQPGPAGYTGPPARPVRFVQAPQASLPKLRSTAEVRYSMRVKGGTIGQRVEDWTN